ncbi:MAG TPA: hypothetical protein VFW07_16240 [Parafilimonas sp.]|nr:hypothetical protein [Parafilimonas sp.]
MRLLLLSFTLTCFFFLVPYKSDAIPVFEKAPAVTFIHSLSETGDESYSEYGNHTAIILRCHNIRNSFNQHRCAPDMQMGASVLCFAPVEILPGAGSIEKNCFHCTPIALKLLFPKHYFW